MGYKNLQECVRDLERTKQLKRIEVPIDPYLEVGAIQRRVFQAGGPALLFTNVKGTSFPMVGNIFGTLKRTQFLFRDTLKAVETLIQTKGEPEALLRKPLQSLKLLPHLAHALPKKVKQGPILAHSTQLDQLPPLVSWPNDGGPFITLPLVYTESPAKPGIMHSNLGMYRIQMAGNQYQRNQEVGLHYQIHRGIGVHHAQAVELGQPLRVNIFVGGAPAMMMAAVMPLPEGMAEISFAGVLGGHRIPMIEQKNGPALYAEADFCITGTIDPLHLKPEGPFGDHLGYYSLKHEFPFLKVEQVTHRPGAIWPFTTVGRPPQEDTQFGAFIHQITQPVIPSVIPGIHGVHAVDATGVHPLLLAIGSERYTPYQEVVVPQELLTQANAILGQGQLSLAKYLLIVNKADSPELSIHDVGHFLKHVLERVNWCRDLHFQTCTTIDTLDYSGESINQGSKLVIAAVGPKKRSLPQSIPSGIDWPDGFRNPCLAQPGVLVVQAHESANAQAFADSFPKNHPLNAFPLIVLADDSLFASKNLDNFLWVTFTRSNPAADIYGIGSFVRDKHWGCTGALIIDARTKPQHAKPLEDDPLVEKRVDALAAPGGPLHGVI